MATRLKHNDVWADYRLKHNDVWADYRQKLTMMSGRTTAKNSHSSPHTKRFTYAAEERFPTKTQPVLLFGRQSIAQVEVAPVEELTNVQIQDELFGGHSICKGHGW